jgi:negative regulator of flagellin synthesis FlgM
MKIHETNPEYLRAEQLKSGRAVGTEGAAKDAPQPTRSIPRPDSVKISDAGRALAANEESRPELSPERIAEIRQRILSGTYDSLESVEQVAKRILASGDL